MRCVIILGLLVLGSAIACGDDSPAPFDTNRPATFWDKCEVDSDDCAGSFECLKPEGWNGLVCTKECDETSDCPRWEATGQCAGDYQSQCLGGICNYGCS